MTSPMKICVLGASGFLGTFVYQMICGARDMDSAAVVLVDLAPSPPDILRPIDTFLRIGSAFDETALRDCTVCINLAGRIFAPEFVAGRAGAALAAFVESSMAPIHTTFALFAAPPRWIQVSSISVYRIGDGGAIPEEAALEPPNAYGVGKLCAEYYLRCMAARHNTVMQILRFPDLYGPWHRPACDRRLYPELMRAFLHGTDIRRFGTGNERKDMLHVTDAARAIMTCLRNPVSGIWNVGSDAGYSLNELLPALASESSVAPRIIEVPDRSPVNQLLDGARFREQFGFRPGVSIRDGIINEFRHHVAHGTLG